MTLGGPVLAPGAAHPVVLFDPAVITRLQRAASGWADWVWADWVWPDRVWAA